MALLAGPRPLAELDTPGFGASLDPDERLSLKQYATWLAQALDDIGIDRYHTLGHHTGACLVAEFVSRAAQRVASASMIGSVPLTAAEREEFRQHFSTPIAPTAHGAYLQTTWDYLATLDAAKTLELHHREELDTAGAYLGRYQAYSAVWDRDFTSLYREFRARS